jgi:signal transduction histidine kinase
MTTWLKQVDAWPKQTAALTCVLFVTFVGFLDFITGYETFFFTFYLLPIFLGTWRLGKSFGVLVSALSVAAWVSANVASGEHYSNYFIPVWNAGIMFAIYAIMVFLLAGLKIIHGGLEERVRLRTEGLTREIQQRVRLQKELLETADREQRRIGSELHDGLCQHLTGTALAGHLLGQKLAATSADEAAEASRLVQLIEEGIEMTRNLSRQLDPVELKSAQLTDRFADLAASASERFNIACRFESALAAPLRDDAVASHLLRIGHDAVTNAAGTGHASRINITLDEDGDELVLTVTDDGADGLEQKRAGNELRAMAYRADLIGARFAIERMPARGTRVTCALPVAGLFPADNRTEAGARPSP